MRHESAAAAAEQVLELERVLHGRGFATIRERLNAVESWLGSLPGHAYANVRQPVIQTLNLAHMMPLSAGDTVRWKVAETASGSGSHQRPHVLVKPTAARLVTNLVIATDRRVYHVELQSLDAAYMASVSWTYPEEELAFRRSVVAGRRAEATPAADGIRPEELHFRYRILGDRPAWRPVRAFDDGRRVFIQFPPGTTEAPPLFLVGPEGEVALVNYRIRGSYYVVDRLFAVAELRLGTDDQAVVRIEHRS